MMALPRFFILYEIVISKMKCPQQSLPQTFPIKVLN